MRRRITRIVFLTCGLALAAGAAVAFVRGAHTGDALTLQWTRGGGITDWFTVYAGRPLCSIGWRRERWTPPPPWAPRPGVTFHHWPTPARDYGRFLALRRAFGNPWRFDAGPVEHPETRGRAVQILTSGSAMVAAPTWFLLLTGAAMMAGAIALHIGARRAARVRQTRADDGQCLTCGYDLAGADHDRCPECGGEVTSISAV